MKQVEVENNSQFIDTLTGLYNRMGFVLEANKVLSTNDGDYAIIYFDILRFKAINDLFNIEEGNRLLIYIADIMKELCMLDDVFARFNADKYVLLMNREYNIEKRINDFLEQLHKYGLPFEIVCNFGIYKIEDREISVDACIDRAIMAQSRVKGNFVKLYQFYDESMRKELLSEQEIGGMISSALTNHQFVVYYQPQYNHSTGLTVGAEGLVRWLHPKKGIIYPNTFIPILEKNGYITKLDMYVFDKVCQFLRKIMNENIHVVPISTNFSRYDIFQNGFVEQLESIRRKYDVPAKYLRIEITESVVAGGSQYTNEIVRQLHHYGYVVEMDDFGSGYSSLNVLKDIDFDIMKLDMRFLVNETKSNRGGTILSSVVRMAQWLNMPVIAEGVETIKQADFLRSIGCDYIQGYLYSKPICEEEFKELLSSHMIGTMVPKMSLIETLNACDFWDPESQETLIFSNYVGAAAIFDYHDGEVEINRVNEKYLKEICMNHSQKDIIESRFFDEFDEENKKKYIDMLEKAIESGDEEECETWRTIHSECCGEDYICIRTNVRMIGISKDRFLFYAMIRNITAEKQQINSILESEKNFKVASEQAHIYYWEYTIATHEMRPCFRCIRDFGLPPLLTNYPESAIEMGIFPMEVADMYRDWHRQLEKGVKFLEATVPFTKERLPYRIRYTTEFDETGRPIKAYGSATLVVDLEK